MTAFADLFVNAWRTALTALVLPPVPFIALAVWGAWRARRQRRGGMGMVLVAAAGLWFSNCDVTADALQALDAPPPPLSAADIAALAARERTRGHLAIVMLGGGVDPVSPEYGQPQLDVHSAERLRYALWLGRRTGIPVGASGGLGPGQAGDRTAEALVADRLAREAIGQPLRWTDTRSRTTRENAAGMLPLLARDGVREVWIVTHWWHMRRALRDFDRVAARLPPPGLVVQPAPMGFGQMLQLAPLRWLPSSEAGWRVRVVLREWLGMLAGA